jgi:hypothetical protein
LPVAVGTWFHSFRSLRPRTFDFDLVPPAPQPFLENRRQLPG